MNSFARVAFATCLSLVAAVEVTGGRALGASPDILGGEPCTPDGSTCRVAIVREGGLHIGRSFSFEPRQDGNLLVQFNGTLYCVATIAAKVPVVVDLVSEITTDRYSTARLGEPSTLRHANVFIAKNTSMTFNLASSRVVPVTAGKTATFYFTVAARRVDDNVECYYYTANFSAVFAP
jgi:hypothetical protein